ncbi:CBS domain-containing protein [Streptomyces sp. NPDC020799]|uniref:CBS domain-containing protein n=1 Tax=unclassified Streptomyces TaxID=2593676 RepID=UPI0033F694B0
MKHRQIRQVMSREVVTVTPDTPLKRIAELFARNDISGVPVVGTKGTVLGVVSESDLVFRQTEESGRRRPWHRRSPMGPRGPHGRAGARTAGQLMTSPAVTIGPESTVADAARTMAGHRVERLPVVDEERRLMGIVTRSDLLSVFRRPDADLRAEVVDEVVVNTLWLDPHMVDVVVRDGVVTLSGTLERRSEAAIALRLAGSVDGVVGVVDELDYREDDSRTQPTEQALHGVAGDWLRKL